MKIGIFPVICDVQICAPSTKTMEKTLNEKIQDVAKHISDCVEELRKQDTSLVLGDEIAEICEIANVLEARMHVAADVLGKLEKTQ